MISPIKSMAVSLQLLVKSGLIDSELAEDITENVRPRTFGVALTRRRCLWEIHRCTAWSSVAFRSG